MVLTFLQAHLMMPAPLIIGKNKSESILGVSRKIKKKRQKKKEGEKTKANRRNEKLVIRAEIHKI